MTRRRWIADEAEGNRAALTGDHANHLARVLRVRIGQEFDISTGNSVRRGRVTSIDRQRIEFELGEELPAETAAQLTLLLSVIKFDRMEWAIEKCVELGVSRIVPTIAQRTDAHLAAAAPKRAERWRRIALQAAEQSRQVNPPAIAAPVKLSEASKKTAGLHVVMAETEDQISLGEILLANSVSELTLAIGPEGGWAPSELDLFRDRGWFSASLGKTILRAETAAIAATSIALSLIS